MAQADLSEKGEKAEEEALPEAAAAAPKQGNPWLPVIAVVVLIPVITMVITQSILIPTLKNALGAAGAASGSTPAAETAAPAESPKGKKGEETKVVDVLFDNIVVNLAGAKGTRYLKTSFTVYSSGGEAAKKNIEDHKNELLDMAIEVLSAKSLADLADVSAQTTIRNELIENFNQALKSKVIEQLYFSEFVAQ